MVTAPPKCVYVLHGSDQFLLDAHRKEIIETVIGDADPQVCVSTLDGTAELAAVLDELRTLPFLASRRVVLVRDADAFIGAHREKLEDYLKAPSATGTLVLVAGSFPKNTRLYKAVAKVGEIRDCTADPKRDLGRFLQSAATKRGKKIAPEAAELMIACKGADLAALDAEMEKLSLYVGPRGNITAEDVSTLVVSTAGPAAFALTNALTAGDAAGALTALDGMLTQRGEEFKTLGMIAWHLRKVLKVRQLLDSGAPGPEACKAARVFFDQRGFLGMVQRRPLAKVEEDFRRLIRADLGMKSGLDATTALQQLVVGLCG